MPFRALKNQLRLYPDSKYHITIKYIVTLELQWLHMVVKDPYGLICMIGHKKP